MTTPTPRRRLRAVALAAATTGTALLAALLVGELVVRIVMADITTMGNSTDAFARRWLKAKVTRNSLGFREREFSEKPADGVYRIAVIGDSFTYGLGIDQDDRMTEQLAKLLGGTSPSLEILNFGRPGRETEDHVQSLREVVLPLEPDFVLMQWLSNDVEGTEKSGRPTAVSLIPWEWASYRFRAVSTLFALADQQFGHAQRALGLVGGYMDSMNARFSDPSSPGMIKAEADLREFISLAKRAGVGVGIVAFPNLAPADSVADYPLGFLIDRVMAVCADEQIPCLDLREPLLEVDGRDGWWANRLDSHPGPLTNAVAAEAVASFFREQWSPVGGSPQPLPQPPGLR